MDKKIFEIGKTALEMDIDLTKEFTLLEDLGKINVVFDLKRIETFSYGDKAICVGDSNKTFPRFYVKTKDGEEFCANLPWQVLQYADSSDGVDKVEDVFSKQNEENLENFSKTMAKKVLLMIMSESLIMPSLKKFTGKRITEEVLLEMKRNIEELTK